MRLHETETVKAGEGLAVLRSARPDVAVVVAYGEILTREVLTSAPLGVVNLHFSLLPRWRGAAPVQRAILAGDPTTGASTMRIDEGVDTGPVFLRRAEPILPEDDAGTLGARLAGTGSTLLVETIRRIDVLEPLPQREDFATLAPKVTADERWIEWDEPAVAVVRRVRALAPEPGASARHDGRVLKVLRAEVAPGRGEPGTIVEADKVGFVVAAGGGSVRPLEVAPEGRRRMSAAEFARGARLRRGDRLA